LEEDEAAARPARAASVEELEEAAEGEAVVVAVAVAVVVAVAEVGVAEG